MSEPWYPWCLKEIDEAVNARRKRLTQWESDFLITIRKRIQLGLSLSSAQENSLRRLHERMTELRRLKY